MKRIIVGLSLLGLCTVLVSYAFATPTESSVLTYTYDGARGGPAAVYEGPLGAVTSDVQETRTLPGQAAAVLTQEYGWEQEVLDLWTDTSADPPGTSYSITITWRDAAGAVVDQKSLLVLKP